MINAKEAPLYKGFVKIFFFSPCWRWFSDSSAGSSVPSRQTR